MPGFGELDGLTPQKDADLEAATAALLAFVKHGVPHDIQELLVHGSKREGIAPGALSAAIRAAIDSYRRS